jgi:hypothetical protein
MKVLKFRASLVPLIISGDKNSTWRLFDDKDLKVGDDLELKVFVTLKTFARAHITKVIEKKFGDLTTSDKQGHEEYKNDNEMYAEHTKYYKVPVNSQTPVKIIWFELDR